MGKKIIRMAVALMALLLFLSSCTVPEAINSAMGNDVYDYSGEKIKGYVTEGDIYDSICESIGLLTLDSVNLYEFTEMSDAIVLYRDSVLNYMYDTSFAMYAGNSAYLEKVAEKYPDYQLIAAIPKSDYERVVYQYFGGDVKISHKSSELFRFLSGADVYVPVSLPVRKNIDTKVETIAETASTYRVTFTLSSGDSEKRYMTVIVKREDGTMYFDLLSSAD